MDVVGRDGELGMDNGDVGSAHPVFEFSHIGVRVEFALFFEFWHIGVRASNLAELVAHQVRGVGGSFGGCKGRSVVRRFLWMGPDVMGSPGWTLVTSAAPIPL